MKRGNRMSDSFHVSYSEYVARQLQDLHLQAASQGIGPKFIQAFRTIHEQLRVDPEQFGDPLYPLPALKAIVYHRVVSPLVVDYAVYAAQRIVWVKGFKLLYKADS